MISWREDFAPGAEDAAVVAVVALTDDELAPTERDLAEAPARGPLRSAFLRRRAATRRAVAARLGILPQSVEIGHAISGAPQVLRPKSALKISVGGREDFCAIAMAQTAIGVDIEPLGQAIEPPWRTLHARERAALQELTGAAQHEAFLRLWTAKEAYLKALGVGFAREPTRIAIDFDFGVCDEEAAPKITARDWRRLALNGREFIAACVVLA